MNAAKIDRTIRGLTSIAKKVYAAVPKGESWTIPQILAELERGGQRYGQKMISGCLQSLKDDGLVKEPKPGTFIQVTPGNRPALQPVPTVKDNNPPPKEKTVAAEAQKTEEPDAIEMLVDLAARLDGMARSLSSAAESALAISQRVADQAAMSEQRIEKLTQLQKLLKELA